MIEINISEWVVWVFIAMWTISIIVKAVLALVTKENNNASKELIATLERVNKELDRPHAPS